MRERELDEFASIFQRSILPRIEVERLRIDDIVVLADFSERAVACGEVARELKGRFGSRVSTRFLLAPQDHEHEDEARRIMKRVGGDEQRVVEGDPAVHLDRICREEQPSLILAPAPLHLHEEGADADALGRIIERLLVSTPIPTLLLRSVPKEPVFRRILAKVPEGRHDLTPTFAFAFALCPPGGAVHLLYVLDESRLRELAELLEVAPGIDTAGGVAEVRDAVEGRMDRLLRSAVRAGRERGFRVDSEVRLGDPLEIVPAEAGEYDLLILRAVGTHAEFLESRAYELMKRIPGMPVLAL